MLIDFHTHFFPDAIAQKSMEILSAKAGVGFSGNGTLTSLLSFMGKDGVDISVNLPVATQPAQVTGINNKMIALSGTNRRVICFGAMHPAFDGGADEIARLAAAGIKGIKLHPEYQNFCPQDRRLFPLYAACAKHRMMVLLHAGVDLGYDDVHCTPEGVRDLAAVPGLTVVLAHMGGYQLWDAVERHLVGTDFYFDLAYCAEMENQQLRRMITNHGADKILFATDFPWQRAPVLRKKVAALELSAEDREKIFSGNAARLLQLPPQS